MLKKLIFLHQCFDQKPWFLFYLFIHPHLSVFTSGRSSPKGSPFSIRGTSLLIISMFGKFGVIKKEMGCVTSFLFVEHIRHFYSNIILPALEPVIFVQVRKKTFFSQCAMSIFCWQCTISVSEKRWGGFCRNPINSLWFSPPMSSIMWNAHIRFNIFLLKFTRQAIKIF